MRPGMSQKCQKQSIPNDWCAANYRLPKSTLCYHFNENQPEGNWYEAPRVDCDLGEVKVGETLYAIRVRTRYRQLT